MSQLATAGLPGLSASGRYRSFRADSLEPRAPQAPRGAYGYTRVLVKVDEVGQVLALADQIGAMQFEADAVQPIVQTVDAFVRSLQMMLGSVGAVARLVAALGIANPVTTAILERTSEVGLMKTVGAANRGVLALFLGEATGIGFVGGLAGVAVGWLDSLATRLS
jgi:putative ABC transport system permease protein